MNLYQWINKKNINMDKGHISVADLPLAINRFFIVDGVSSGFVRGHHAHKKCTQILNCLRGGIEVLLDNGIQKETLTLTPESQSLIIPPLIWSSQLYQTSQSQLLVLADLPYDEDEYIRDYEQFLKEIR